MNFTEVIQAAARMPLPIELVMNNCQQVEMNPGESGLEIVVSTREVLSAGLVVVNVAKVAALQTAVVAVLRCDCGCNEGKYMFGVGRGKTLRRISTPLQGCD